MVTVASLLWDSRSSALKVKESSPSKAAFGEETRT